MSTVEIVVLTLAAFALFEFLLMRIRNFRRQLDEIQDTLSQLREVVSATSGEVRDIANTLANISKRIDRIPVSPLPDEERYNLLPALTVEDLRALVPESEHRWRFVDFSWGDGPGMLRTFYYRHGLFDERGSPGGKPQASGDGRTHETAPWQPVRIQIVGDGAVVKGLPEMSSLHIR